MGVIKDYLEHIDNILMLSNQTKKCYLDSINVFLKFRFNKTFFEISLDELSTITSKDIGQFNKYLNEKKNCSKTILTRMDGVKSLLIYLDHEELVDKQEYERLMKDFKIICGRLNKKAKNEYTKPEYLTLNEVSEVLKHLSVSKNKFRERRLAAVSLILTGGLRVSELSNLKIEDIDLKNKLLVIRSGKGDKDRVVYLDDSTLTIIKQYLSKRSNFKSCGRYLFTSTRSEQMSVRAFQHEVKDVIEELSIDKHISPHKLRRTFATIMSSNTSNFNLKSLLGHENITTTDIYVNSDENALREAISSNPINNILNEFL